MKIGVICPYRPGDKPEFLDQFKKYIAAQTLKPDCIFYKNYEPESDEVDVTQRYRRGYEEAQIFECDIVLFMEFDDFYHPTYIETMLAAWEDKGRPDLLTLASSFYYHISGKYFEIGRPSANTFLLRTGLPIKWGDDNYAYVDVTLLGQLQRRYHSTPTPICIGIKHGIGMVGGGCHNSDNERYTEMDADGSWLKGIVGDENWEFYKSLKENI